MVSQVVRIARLTVVTFFVAGGLACAADGPRMRAPMTYVIDYSRRYLDDAANIEAMREAPPYLMHVGKSVPVLHNWGPVPLISGENQYTGGPGHTLKWEAIRLLTPEELSQRIDRLTAYTKNWHDIGVPRLICYSSYHTIAGDHTTRKGFWEFYDRWDDYARWLGPRPKSDPFTWLMIDRKGKFVPGACGGYAPKYYAPLHRYRVCPEHPEWRKLQTRLTKLIAEVGYDGVFPDNSNPTNTCFCPHCRREFKAFVKRLSPHELKILGAKEPVEQLELLSADTPPELIRRYRIDTSCRYQRMVRTAGRTVNPNFEVFPNINSYSQFMPLSESCDYLMFESTYSPGCRFSGLPPTDPFVTIEVGQAPVSEDTSGFQLDVADPRTFIEMAVNIEFPQRATVGQGTRLVARIASLGASNQDGDWAEEFAFYLIDATTGREERVSLQPATTVGGGTMRPQAKRPPAELIGLWTPSRPGIFKLCFAYRYTDEQHLEETRDLTCRHELNLGSIYQTHIGQLLLTMHAGARTVLLDYQCLRKGREKVQELGLAECAAFSSGSTIAARREPRRKYARFFRQKKHLYAGFEPYADIGLLYSYWGFNPEAMGQRASTDATPAEDLASRHRLIKVLMDRTLSAADLKQLNALVLCGDRLEMSDEQMAAVRAFAEAGGKLYVFRPQTTINNLPLSILGKTEEWKPGRDVPGMPPFIEAERFSRGLRFSAFTKLEDERMVLHVVNYNVAIGETPAVLTNVEGVRVTLNLPPGRAVQFVRLHDPDHPSVSNLRFTSSHGQVTATIPRVRTYAVLEIALD